MAEKKTKTKTAKKTTEVFVEWRGKRLEQVVEATSHADTATGFLMDSEEAADKVEFYDQIRDAQWELQRALDLLELLLDGEDNES